MTPSSDPNAGDPVIAGDSMSGSEFDVFSDDDMVHNVLNFMKSPDALQTTMSSDDQKTFLNPQDLVAAGPPDSPTNSNHDSSSDSASSTKQFNYGSMFARPPGTNADQNMEDEADEVSDWRSQDVMSFDGFDSAFFTDREPNHPAADSFFQFGDPDDMVVDCSPFSFDIASRKSDPPGNRMHFTSPDMPMPHCQSPKQAGPSSRMREQGHKKRCSQYSTASSRNGRKSRKREASRDPSPMSTMAAANSLSPPATSHTHPAHTGTGSDLSLVNGVNMWTNRLSLNSPPVSEGNLHPIHFSTMPQEVQMPHFHNNHPSAYGVPNGYELVVFPTPLKSRVETQIPITMMLNHLPPGVTKLHLPPHTISKPKLLARPRHEPCPDTLELFVSLVCTSAMDHSGYMQNALHRATKTPQGHLPDLNDEANSPQNGGEVRICQGCITRERKRAARKKTRKPEEDKLWSQDEERRVIVFNTQEVKDWQPYSGMLDANGRPESTQHGRAVQIDAPMRIACYCRHHHEKMGFNVIFTIKDWKGQVLAQAMSNPIMITDDHKTNPVAQVTPQPSSSSNGVANCSSALLQHALHGDPANGAFSGFSSSAPTATPTNGRSSTSSTSASNKTTPIMASAAVAGRSLSRPSSPVQNGPLPKKRKSSACRVPNELAMTRLDTSPAPMPNGAAAGLQVSAVTSPFSPNPNNPNRSLLPQADALFGQQNHQVPFNHSPLVSNNHEMNFYTNRRSESMDNLALAHLYNSAPTSNHASRAPSPNGLRNSVNRLSQAQLAQSLGNGMFSMSMAVNQSRVTPIIHKIIPNEGPTVGGIEVTVLGASFFQGLEVWFGDNKATTTTYWGDSSLVCLLPPSPTAGVVPVSFGRGVGVSRFQGKQPPTFKYIDDSEDKLIRTALSVLGLKISGKIVDVNDLARRILKNDLGNSNWSGGSPGNSAGSGGGQVFNHTSREHLETQLLNVLDLIDLDSSVNRTRLDLKRSTGHTMLHLACALGYHRLVAALLARGANKDAQDRGGFTPLHLAAIHNHPELVKRLMIAGADLTIRSLSGLTAKDVAQSRAVERTIRSSQQHVRSRSGGSVQSRTTSVTSMGSIWEPLTKVHTHQEPLSVDSSEESPEYTSGDFEDEDPDENVGLSMKRSSRLRLDDDDDDEGSEDSEELNNGSASNTTAMAAAFKEQIQTQFQQLQQTMGLYTQIFTNLPQVGMPQMRTFSGLPMLPDYQAYLQQAPFMRKVQQLVPGMSGSRADTPTDDDQPKMDSRWWDISSYSKNSVAGPPPAYDEIFPQDDLNKKIQSAARAAADAEADLKCATLYNESSTSATDSSTKTKKIPTVLEIGRKNAITREQQDNFLRAREQKLKMLSNDRNLFFIWIPLLLVMICALLYSYFPSLFSFLWTSACALVLNANGRSGRFMESMPTLNRAVEL